MIHGIAKRAALESLRTEATKTREPADSRQTITLTLTYALPAICGTDVDAARLANADLAAMALEDLETEAFRLRMALAFGDRRSHPWAYDWMRARLAKCQEASNAE